MISPEHAVSFRWPEWTPNLARADVTDAGAPTVASMRTFGAFVTVALLLLGCGAPSGAAGGERSSGVRSEASPSPTAALTVGPEPISTAVVVVIPTAELESLELSPTPTPTPTPVRDPTPPPVSESAAALTPLPTVTPEPDDVRLSDETPTGDTRPELPPSDYRGDVRALRTQNGVMLPIRGVTADKYLVVTPCYNLDSVTGGLPISGALDVVIDPGHGGDEPGAVGPNGLKESTVNLRVAELLRAELMDRGYSVELTRYSDHRVTIQSRAELANALAPRVFMSIHHNGGFPEPFPVAGTEVFVQLGDPESSRLGGIVFEEIQSAFADVEADWMGNVETFGVAWRQNDEGTDLYGVLRRTPDLVSILTEAMFITTAAEADLLAMPDILETEAIALADSLDRWFDTDDLGSGFVDGVVFEGDLGNGGGTEGCIDPPL